ncbi:MAG: carboxylating nicotinate-nucleotide diphosphorylase [Nitrospirae bacterium]|nr:MAG: carboxylating nicotinate-nucleotide diphosphorylase [Nitrospirota bacterium]
MPVPSTEQIRTAIRRALDEDLAWGDVTTAALFPAPIPARGTVTAHQKLVLAGMAVAREVFTTVDPRMRVVRALKDGTPVKKGQIVLTVQGDARSLLMAERVALNFLQHLSGIATLTGQFCHAVRGGRATILDTRKTTPGLRILQKWAVTLGGGQNHRHSLGDGILIKDNHLLLLQGRHIGIAQACMLARKHAPHGLRISVEVQTLEQTREALRGEADVILLDNMTPSLVRKAVALIHGRALTEVSGGVTLQNVREMAEAGADFISIGALTHSAPAADLSMDILPLRLPGQPRKQGR